MLSSDAQMMLQDVNPRCTTFYFHILTRRLCRHFKMPVTQHQAHRSFVGAHYTDTWLQYLNSRVTDITWHFSLLAAPHHVIPYFLEAVWPFMISPAITLRQRSCRVWEFAVRQLCKPCLLINWTGKGNNQMDSSLSASEAIDCLIAPSLHGTDTNPINETEICKMNVWTFCHYVVHITINSQFLSIFHTTD